LNPSKNSFDTFFNEIYFERSIGILGFASRRTPDGQICPRLNRNLKIQHKSQLIVQRTQYKSYLTFDLTFDLDIGGSIPVMGKKKTQRISKTANSDKFFVSNPFAYFH
jgi:hypothetical protein